MLFFSSFFKRSVKMSCGIWNESKGPAADLANPTGCDHTPKQKLLTMRHLTVLDEHMFEIITELGGGPQFVKHTIATIQKQSIRKAPKRNNTNDSKVVIYTPAATLKHQYTVKHHHCVIQHASVIEFFWHVSYNVNRKLLTKRGNSRRKSDC